jgi:beta-lactamase class D
MIQRLVACSVLVGAVAATQGISPASCFLLYEIGVGQVRRSPDSACSTRLSPASTFKIPHALAALDAGVVSSPDEKFTWDGTPRAYESWRRDHTLASAMRYSVLWYFQRIAEKLGMAREREYLKRFDYGNADPSSGLTTFWLGESLLISPDEQQRFLLRLFNDDLPVSKAAMTSVRQILVQPRDRVVNALGEHPFAAPWPAEAVVSAKTGSATDRAGRAVRWLVGHVQRGSRAWIFVSAVNGNDDLPALAAVDLAAKSLREEGVLRWEPRERWEPWKP